MKLLNFSLFLWVVFFLLDPDPLVRYWQRYSLYIIRYTLIDLLNVLCRVWLATYEKQANAVDTRDEERVRDFIIAKVTPGLPHFCYGVMIFPWRNK
jgi:hypothetical protein